MAEMRKGDTNQRTNHRCRWLRVCWRCLICWLITFAVIALVFYLVEYYRCSRFTPTGDALFDRYARAVIKCQAPRLWFQRPCDFLIPQAHIPDSELAEWESEFGSDPRYWQLRSWNANQDEETTYMLEQVPCWRESEWETGRRYDYLIKGYQGGSRDWVMVTHIARAAQRDMWDALEERKSRFGEPGTEEFKANFGASKSELESEVQALFKEAIELDPDQAWPYYERALYWMDLGEYELAEVDFAMGNRAAEITYPSLFPKSFVLERLNETNYRTNGSISGALLTASHLRTDLFWWMRVKEHMKELIVATELGGTTSLNNEFHSFLCRTIRAKYNDKANEAAAFSSLKLLYSHYLTTHPELSFKERQALLAILQENCDAQMLFFVDANRIADTSGCIISYLPEVMSNPMMQFPEMKFARTINPNYGKYQRFNWRCYFMRQNYEDVIWAEMVSQQLEVEYFDSLVQRLEYLDLMDISAYCDEFGQYY